PGKRIQRFSLLQVEGKIGSTASQIRILGQAGPSPIACHQSRERRSFKLVLSFLQAVTIEAAEGRNQLPAAVGVGSRAMRERRTGVRIAAIEQISGKDS